MQLTRASLRTAGIWLAVLVAVLLAAECVARLEVVRRLAITPAVTTALRPLDLQVAGIDAMARRRGRVDCIILGSSVAWTSLDPRAIDAGRRLSGSGPLHCYNFGLPALTVEEAAPLLRLLVRDYQPAVLVYAFTVRDFRPVAGQVDPERILGLPWVRHRLGSPSFEGWLVEHSAAFRQALPYRLLVRPRAWEAMRWHDREPSIDGYRPSNVVEHAWSGISAARSESLFGGGDEPATPPALEALADVLGLAGEGVQVVLLEAPVPRPTLRTYAPVIGEYRAVVRAVRRLAREHGAPLLRRSGAIVPDEGWRDPFHMNEIGATRWSRWVGGRLATLPRHARLVRTGT